MIRINIVSTLILAIAVSAQPPVVQTPSGPVEGFTLTTFTGKEINAFFGVPYAKPPLGELRFKKPEPVEPWTEVLKATSLPPICPQIWMKEFWLEEERPSSEDCLYLTISVPKTTNSKIPVMVRIHGGGFIFGGTSLAMCNSTTFAAEEEVIMVSLNYRLGVMGFLYLDTPGAPGNVGLWDQNLALKWVKENIEAFGGDPDSITIVGESAGGASTNYHVLSSHSHPYFNRAILDSGSALNNWAYMEPKKTLDYALKLAKVVGCENKNREEIVKCLQNVDAKLLVLETIKLTPAHPPLSFLFVPTLDKDFLISNPTKLAEKGNFKKANLLMGVTSNEGIFLLIIDPNFSIDDYSKAHFHGAASLYAPNGDKLITDIIAHLYTNWTDPNSKSNALNSVDQLFSDTCFNCKVNKFIDHAVESGSTVYKYVFDYPQAIPLFPPGRKYCIHTAQALHMMGIFLDPQFGMDEESRGVSKKIMRLWANFARTGDPNVSPDGSTLPTPWPKYSAKSKEYYRIQEITDKVEYGYRENTCAFWREILPKLVKERESCNAV